MRQRSRYACLPCRQRKRKCDGKYPCSTCTGYGYDCQYKAATASPNTVLSPLPQGTKRKSPGGDVDERPYIAQKQTTRTSSSASSLGRAGEKQLKEEQRPSTNGFLVPSKSRFIGRHSSTAFPQWVGMKLQSACPPRVHSFAYNSGVRSELSYAVTFKLHEYLTWAEVHDSINVYEAVIHPVFGFIDMDTLRRRSHEHWHDSSKSNPQGSSASSSANANFEALISGVVALASLFSQVLCEARELRIVQHAKDILDDPAVARFPTLDTMSAWILRTLYTRSTSRPGITWQYSCTMMHLCENIGASREPASEKHTTTALHAARDLRARLAIVARCLHVFISYEHGRSCVEIGPIPEHNVIARQGDLTMQFNALVSMLPSDTSTSSTSSRDQRHDELCAALGELLATPTDHDFLTLIRADLCFCVYRRLRLLELGLKPEQLEQVMAVGRQALPAARSLVLQNHPWWNIVGSVFQFLCVLLAIDSSESLAALPETLETLETITKHLQTHLANEALGTAKLLLRAMKEKKRKEADLLERIAPSASDSAEINNGSEETVDAGQLLLQQQQQQQHWSGMVDFTDPMWNWDAFFEPMASPFAEPGLQWTPSDTV